LLAGAVIATVVTDGLIIPAYAWVTGTSLAEMGAAGGMGAGAGAGMAGAGAGGGAGAGAGAAVHGFRSIMQVLGAVGGGFYADSRYSAK
jgi:hypothetical protein